MLLLPIENEIFQKTHNKKYAFMPLGLSHLEMILVLFTKVIALYM